MYNLNIHERVAALLEASRRKEKRKNKDYLNNIYSLLKNM